jgi:hypothetical protein
VLAYIIIYRLGDGVAVYIVDPDGVAGAAGICVGDTKMILMALSSGMGDTTLLLVTSAPTITATITKTPIINVIAASVRFLSSIP